MRRTLGLLVGLGMLTLACGDDGNAGDGGSGSSTGSDSTGNDDVIQPTAGNMTTTGMSGTGSTTDPGEDTTAGPGTTTDDPGDTDGTTTDDPTGGESSSGGGGDPLYPPCGMDGSCPDDNACYPFLLPDYSVCTLPCMEDADCPQPATGDAMAVCAGMMMNQCLIDCANGETCPDGMECQTVGGGMMTFSRCVWPTP